MWRTLVWQQCSITPPYDSSTPTGCHHLPTRPEEFVAVTEVKLAPVGNRNDTPTDPDVPGPSADTVKDTVTGCPMA